MRKILIVVNNSKSGHGTFADSLLKLDDFNVVIYSLRSSTISKNGLLDIVFLSFFIKVIGDFFKISKVIARNRPDAILSVDVYMQFLVQIRQYIYNSKIPTIFTIHNNLVEVLNRKTPLFLRRISFLFTKWLIEGSEQVICVSDGLRLNLISTFNLKKDINVIPYGINISKAQKLSLTRVLTDNKTTFSKEIVTVISVGRLEDQKDFLTLIEAVKEIKKDINAFQLLIIGDGRQYESIKKRIKILDLESTIKLLGWKRNIFPYLKNANIFVLSTNYEGFGYVLLEAMALGLPIISSDVPYGPSEVLQNGKYGILSKKGDSTDLAHKILLLMKNKAMHSRYAKLSKKRAKNYSELKMRYSYKALIQKALDK